MCWEENKLGHQKDLGSSSGLALVKLCDCGQLLSLCESVRIHPSWFLKLLPSVAFCPFQFSPEMHLLKKHAAVTWHLEFLLPLDSCFFTQPFSDGAPQGLLLDVVCLHSLLPSPPPHLCQCVVCLALMDEWLTPLHWTPSRDLGLNFMPARVITFLEAVSKAPQMQCGQNRCIIFLRNTCSSLHISSICEW